jgi:hypothetical protein
MLEVSFESWSEASRHPVFRNHKNMGTARSTNHPAHRRKTGCDGESMCRPSPSTIPLYAPIALGNTMQNNGNRNPAAVCAALPTPPSMPLRTIHPVQTARPATRWIQSLRSTAYSASFMALPMTMPCSGRFFQSLALLIADELRPALVVHTHGGDAADGGGFAGGIEDFEIPGDR